MVTTSTVTVLVPVVRKTRERMFPVVESASTSATVPLRMSHSYRAIVPVSFGGSVAVAVNVTGAHRAGMIGTAVMFTDGAA